MSVRTTHAREPTNRFLSKDATSIPHRRPYPETANAAFVAEGVIDDQEDEVLAVFVPVPLGGGEGGVGAVSGRPRDPWAFVE